jgi:hypothetical protein
VNLPHVFAKTTMVASDLGVPIHVQMGSHWLADDPLVKARPDLFTADCRFGLTWAGEPPHVMTLPPDVDVDDEGEPVVRGHRRAPAGRP